MDETEQKQSEDSPVSESAAASSTSTVEPKPSKELTPESEMAKSETSTDGTTTSPLNPEEGSRRTTTASVSAETSIQASVMKSPDLPPTQAGVEERKEEASSEELEGGVKKPVKQSSAQAGSSGNVVSSHDKNLSGASSVPGLPSADGAVSPGSNNVMAKMMEMMAKGSASATPKNADKGKGPMGDMMSGGGGMPDMMAMMSGGGMPDMTSMMSGGGGGMPDMAAMMSAGGNMANMKSMMNKMGGGMMATLFDKIISDSINKYESETSDDDEDSITIEIPCKYCSRYFTSQMSLKTHILVAHEHEDSSVLNLQKLVIDKGKRSAKGHGARRKQSKDLEKSAAGEAASDSSHQHAGSTVSKVTTSQEDSSAAESSRGIKRGRSERSKSQAAESSGASGLEESTLLSAEGLLRLGTGAVPSSCVSGNSPPESRKRSVRIRSLGSNSGPDPSYQVTSKKSKSGDEKTDSDSTQEGSPSGDPAPSGATKSGNVQPSQGDPKSQRMGKETSKHKHNKAESKQPSPSRLTPVMRGKRVLPKDIDMPGSDRAVGAEAPAREASRSGKGRQSSSVQGGSGGVPAPGASSAQESETASTSRRSLRSHKSH
ncbi:hypothetical protein ACOMHN_019606 [Nucella lapillus]